MTSLGTAILNDNWSVFAALLAMGVDASMIPLPSDLGPDKLDLPDTWFAAPLLAATMYNAPILAATLAFGASTGMRTPSPDGRTSLHLAAGRYGSPASSFEDSPLPDYAKDWPLDRAVLPKETLHEFQHLCISILVAAGADVDVRDYRGDTPLMYALENELDMITADLLLNMSPTPANIDAQEFTGNTSLHKAVGDGHHERLKFCLSRGARTEIRNLTGLTPLGLAVKEGNLRACEELLRHGAHIDAQDANGQNSIGLAVQWAQLEILHFLTASLSEDILRRLVLTPDCRGWNALRLCIATSATNEAFTNVFRQWIEDLPDLDLDQRDLCGLTLLHMAVICNPVCLEILLKNGASVDIKDSICGWTPLHHACNQAHSEVLNYLLAFGADFYMKDDLMGWTPWTMLEQSTDKYRTDKGEMDSERRKRKRQARRRIKLWERTGRFFAEESARRLTVVVNQKQIDRETENARAKVFPECRPAEERSPETGEPLRIWNCRNLRRCFMMNADGQSAAQFWIDPSGGRIPCE